MSTSDASLGTVVGGNRTPLSSVSLTIFSIIALAGMIAGVVVGVATGNGYFVFVMVGLSVASVLLFATLQPEEPGTRPTSPSASVVLPVIALVVAASGASVVGIALGHASRHVIATRGGEGEKIALAALIVGYSLLALEIGALAWIITAAQQYFG